MPRGPAWVLSGGPHELTPLAAEPAEPQQAAVQQGWAGWPLYAGVVLALLGVGGGWIAIRRKRRRAATSAG